MSTASAANPPLGGGARVDAVVLDVVVLDFDDVYDAHFEFVWRCLRRLGVREPALDDAMQDVFLVVHRRLATFEGRSSMKTWLFGIAYRVANDVRRAAKRRGEAEPLPDELPDAGELPDEVLEKKRSLELLDALLGALDDDKRALLTMVDIEDMSVPEVAEALGINVNTAYSRLRAARREFATLASNHAGGPR